jgi:methyl-accepting chemotaxis protein
MQHTPNLSTICDALRVCDQAKATAEHTAKDLEQIRTKLKITADFIQQTVASLQQNCNTVEEARAAAQKATAVGKATLEIARDIKNRALQQQTNVPVLYAAVAA